MGIHYSMGGTGSVVKALEKLMIEENIKIIKNESRNNYRKQKS